MREGYVLFANVSSKTNKKKQMTHLCNAVASSNGQHRLF